MNIFFLDRDPTIAAQMLHDKHVVKMVLETAQILSTVVHEYRANVEGIYKPTHRSHPCVVWAGESFSNFWWTYEHGVALAYEYEYRYGKTHASEDIIIRCGEELGYESFDEDSEISEPPQAMPDEYKVPGDAVAAYRKYYLGRKIEQSRWTRRPVPAVFEKAIEMKKHDKQAVVPTATAPADAPATEIQPSAAPEVLTEAPKNTIGVRGPKGVDLEAKITVLAATNPKRPSSKAHAAFANYRTGMTVKEFMDAVGTEATGHLQYDTAHQFISIEGYTPKKTIEPKPPRVPKPKKEKAPKAEGGRALAPAMEASDVVAETVDESIE